jgi:hypothetical protein
MDTKLLLCDWLKRLGAVFAYAIAMAWVESAVVTSTCVC